MRFITFAMVGAVGTATQYLLLILLVTFVNADAVVASALGFVAGGLVNYWLNYHVTFRSNNRHISTIWRFFVIAFIGLLLNTSLMAIATKIFILHYLIAQLTATALVLIWNYLGNSRWTFSGRTYGKQ